MLCSDSAIIPKRTRPNRVIEAELSPVLLIRPCFAFQSMLVTSLDHVTKNTDPAIHKKQRN